jgi:hypothetical protein
MAAYLACRIHFASSIDSYREKKKELGIQGELTFAESKAYRERFPFMN